MVRSGRDRPKLLTLRKKEDSPFLKVYFEKLPDDAMREKITVGLKKIVALNVASGRRLLTFWTLDPNKANATSQGAVRVDPDDRRSRRRVEHLLEQVALLRGRRAVLAARVPSTRRVKSGGRTRLPTVTRVPRARTKVAWCPAGTAPRHRSTWCWKLH